MMINKNIEDVGQKGRTKCHKSWSITIFILICVTIMFVFDNTKADTLESWQSCCGAVCLRTVSGLLGNQTDLGEIRELLQPNNKGETSLAEIAETAKKMGFYATGFRIKSEKLNQCSIPLIAHKPPKHFVVLLGLGKGKGILIIDPPNDPRKVTAEELTKQEHWNVVGISNHPIITKGQRIGQLQDQTTKKEKVPNEYGGLRFDSIIWNFGSVNPGYEKTYEFSFENINKRPINLNKVKANCACLKVVHFTEKVAPGENGVIKVLLDTKGIQGYVAKKIIGIINNVNTEKNEQFLLTVFGEVSRRGELLLRPSVIHLPDFVKGSKISKSLNLRRIGFDQLFLKEIKPSSPAVSAKITDVLEADPYEAHIDVQIEAQGKFGPFEHEVLFETDYAEYPTAKLNIHGNVVSHISVEPAELFLGLLSQQGNLKKTITVRSKTATPFKIKTAKTNVDNVGVGVLPDNETQTVWHITLTNTGPLQTGILKGMVLVETNDPDVPKIHIPFTGLVVG